MSVYKDAKRGTWYVSYSVREKDSKNYKHITKRGFKTKKEAQDWEVRQKATADDTRPTNKTTFKEMAIKWENYIDSSEDSRHDHKTHFELRFATLYHKPIIDISKQDLVDWRVWLSTTEYSTITKNKTISYVRGVYKFANTMFDIPNISVILKNFKKTEEEVTKEMDVWTPEEFNKFVESVDNPEVQVFFKFLFWTGCRRGEAIALQKRHVGDRSVTLRYSQKKRKKGLKSTKTKNVRNIAIDDVLWEELQPYIQGKKGYVFGNPNGFSPSTVTYWYQKGIKDSGVKYIKLHNLRHSHATWLICNGVNIVAVSKRLGHASITQTLETYTHLLKETDSEMMCKINEFKKGA